MIASTRPSGNQPNVGVSNRAGETVDGADEEGDEPGREAGEEAEVGTRRL